MYGKCCCLEFNKSHSDDIYNRPKGKFSINYLKSMCSYLGYGLTEPEPGDDINKVDAIVTSLYIDKWKIHTPMILFQAKTTSNKCCKRTYVNYRIETKTLRRMRDSSTEHLLVVLCISQNPDKWVVNTDNGLLLEKDMYWYNPKKDGLDYKETEKTTIKIPLSNKLTVKTLHKMMEIIGNGGEIGNVI